MTTPTPKFCKDCRHIIVHKNPECVPACAITDSPFLFDLVTGEHFGIVKRLDCYAARRQFFDYYDKPGGAILTPCGPDAKLFQPKDKP